jgi:pullulanase
LQAGEEILRSKPTLKGYDENSYKSPDKVNSIKWDEKTVNIDTYEYYRGLIAFRKANPELRLKTSDEIRQSLEFLDNCKKNIVSYRIGNIIAIFNSNKEEVCVNLPNGKWNIYVNDKTAGTQVLSTVQGIVRVPKISAVILKADG